MVSVEPEIGAARGEDGFSYCLQHRKAQGRRTLRQARAARSANRRVCNEEARMAAG